MELLVLKICILPNLLSGMRVHNKPSDQAHQRICDLHFINCSTLFIPHSLRHKLQVRRLMMSIVGAGGVQLSHCL